MDLPAIRSLIGSKKLSITEKLDKLNVLIPKVGLSDINDIRYHHESTLILIEMYRVMQIIDFQLEDVIARMLKFTGVLDAVESLECSEQPRIDYLATTCTPDPIINSTKDETNLTVCREISVRSTCSNNVLEIEDCLLDEVPLSTSSHAPVDNDLGSSHSSISVKLNSDDQLASSNCTTNPFLNPIISSDGNETESTVFFTGNESFSDNKLPENDNIPGNLAELPSEGNSAELPPERNSAELPESKDTHSVNMQQLEQLLTGTEMYKNGVCLKFETRGKKVSKKPKPKDKQNYVLRDGKLKDGDDCVVCHVESPDEFYVQTDLESVNELSAKLNDAFALKYSSSESKYWDKKDAIHQIGDNNKFCVVYLDQWYRAEILDWMPDSNDVSVLLVDFGRKAKCHYNDVRRMTQFFSEPPKLAIKCSLASVSPPEGTKEWPDNSIEMFKRLTHYRTKEKKIFLPYFVLKEEGSYRIDLIDRDKLDKGQDDTLVSRLVELKLALNTEEEEEKWSSEEEEILEEKNINELVMGYDAKDMERICPHPRKNGQCYKGARCKLEHTDLFPGGRTTDKVMAYLETFNVIDLPAVGSQIQIIITEYISVVRFYAQLLQANGEYDPRFLNLSALMNDPKSIMQYKPFRFNCASGEIVLVKYESIWERAKFLSPHESDYNSSLVLLLDVGKRYTVLNKNIKQIKEEFLTTPAQAIECCLHNYQLVTNINQEEARLFFDRNLADLQFRAFVLESNSPLGLQVIDLNNVDIGEVLISCGFAKKANHNNWRPGPICPD